MMATTPRETSTFVCEFCEFDDVPRLLKTHMVDEHGIEIASHHWAIHVQ